MIKLLYKRPILTIVSLVGLMLLPFLDVLEVTIMEARNFVSAREMLTDGNWILTTMNGQPRYEKPPLPTWLSAVSASIFGIHSVWAMRFPAVLTVMLLGSMVFTLSRKLNLSKQHSLINSLVCVTSLYVVLIVFEAPWDIYAHTFMFTGICLLFSNLMRPSIQDTTVRQKPYKRCVNLIGAALFIGMSILSKGPVSLYVLFLSFVISYSILFYKDTSQKEWIGLISAVLLGMVIGFSWYIYVRETDPIRFAAFTQKETGNWTGYNVRPFYYYWSFFIQSGLWTIPALISLIYPYLKNRVTNRKGYRFILLWILTAVVLLSIIPEKKSRYLMPVLIPLSIAIGFYIEYLVRCFKTIINPRETFPVYFNFSVIGIGIIVLSLGTIYYCRQLEYVSPLLYVILMAVSILGLGILFELRRKNILRFLIGNILAVVLLINSVSYSRGVAKKPLYEKDEMGDTHYKSLRHLGDLPIYSVDIDSPEVIWSAGKKVGSLNSSIDTNLSDTFYLLISSNCAEFIPADFELFKSEFQGNFDLNYSAVGSKSHKTRKVGQIHKLTRMQQR